MLFAAHRGSLSFVEELLRLRADASSCSDEGNTALMFAAHAGHEDLCLSLLEAEALAAAVNVHGLTAEDMATKRGFQRLAAIIAAYAMAPKDSASNGRGETEVIKEAEVKQLPSPLVEKRTDQAAFAAFSSRKTLEKTRLKYN